MIRWSDNYITGITEIDEEHKKLFAVAAQIYDKVRSRGHDEKMRIFVLREGLHYLKGYFNYHAAREEAYMKKIGFKGYELHKMQHDDFQSVQMGKYQKMLNSGSCSMDDIGDFLGNGIGWLLEHIATADMLIVGKGVHAAPVKPDVNISVLEQTLDSLFAATLNVKTNTHVIDQTYCGSPYGNVLYQMMVCEREGATNTLIAGIERSFVAAVANMLFGERMKDDSAVVLHTVEAFGAQFWISLHRMLTGDEAGIHIKESKLLSGDDVSDLVKTMKPAISILFSSDMGKFSVSTTNPYFLNMTAN